MKANLGRAIVTNGDFTAYVSDSAATRPSSQLTLGKLVGTRPTIQSACMLCGVMACIAEKKTSLGKDWHAMCLKCKKCNKILSPGQHAEVSRAIYVC